MANQEKHRIPARDYPDEILEAWREIAETAIAMLKGRASIGDVRKAWRESILAPEKTPSVEE